MGWIIAGGLILGLLILMLLPVRIEFALHQDGLKAELDFKVEYALLRRGKRVDVTTNVNMALEHMWKRWLARGKPVDPGVQETVSRTPRRELWRAAMRPLRWLSRRTHCRQFRLRAEVGGSDAMESALLTGVVWSGAGMLVGTFSRWIPLPREALAVAVVPNFQKAVWQLNLECILVVRLGKAIIAIVWLLAQVLSRKEVFAWVRDSLRRKGDQTNVRAPHSGPDEVGHGKP